MFKPSAGNSEYIELYNSSTTEIFSIQGYKIQYDQNEGETFSLMEGSYNLLPGTFAVITEGDYDFDNGIYKGIIPEGITVLKLDDNAFGRSGLSNSSNKIIKLINQAGMVISEYTYTANNDYGISDEKIILNGSNDSSNWSNSIIVNGTPGFTNSVSPKINNLSIQSFYSSPGYGILGDAIKLIVEVKNNGMVTADLFSIKFYRDMNYDSIYSANELVFERNYENMPPGDSLVTEFITSGFAAGKNQFIGVIDFPEDEYNMDNIAFLILTGIVVNEVRGDIIINEFMYAPQGQEPEWVEIFNVSGKEINLFKYEISDNASSSIVIWNSFVLMPQEYLVVAKDSSLSAKYDIPGNVIIGNIPSLNNSGDKIILLDSLKRVIDSLEYTASWGGTNGKSLERIDPLGVSSDQTNWKESQNEIGGTPGVINSITQKEFDIEIKDALSNPGHPLIGDNVKINVTVKNIGKNSIQFALQLYELSAATLLIETSTGYELNPSDSLAHQFNYTLTGINKERNFIIYAYAGEDQDTSNNVINLTIKPGYEANTIVINEIMYNPSYDEPEWIEFYNVSNYQIDIKEWKLSDVITTPVGKFITMEEMVINPGSYFVVAKDSSIYNYHRGIPAKLIITNFANLNNDEDGVVLKDFSGYTIDSVLYNQSWRGIKGYSLERKSTNANSNEPGNWDVSIDIEQSTPGRINSITIKEYDLTIQSITTNPQFPVLNDNVYVNVVVKNLGQKPADNFELFINALIDGVNIPITGLYNLSLRPGDSLITVTNQPILLKGEVIVYGNVNYEKDLDTLNNYAEKVITPGYMPQSILINEIMYNPNQGEPEWIELTNNSGEEINIRGWSVSDILSTPTKNIITYEDHIISTGGFVIITSNKFYFDEYSDIDFPLFEVNFGNLSNNKDGIIVYDFRDAVIDSVMYESTWGGKEGKSLERISLLGETQDRANWATCLSSGGSTIGKENSLNQIEACNYGDVIINEIMFAPSDENCEYVEFYNTTGASIEIGGWYLEEESGSTFKLSEESYFLSENEYYVLAADSAILNYYNLPVDEENIKILGLSSLSLSNSGENIKIKDLRGNVIDSVNYSEKFHNENILTTNNKSIERINTSISGNDPANWSTCVNEPGGTPAAINSIHTSRLDNNSSLTISPNPFSPDNDGYEDFAIITFNLTQQIAQLRIKIFDSKGRLVRELLNNSPSGSTGSIVFDGLDNNGKPLKIGIYILFIEALNSSSGVVDILKDVIVIARKL